MLKLARFHYFGLADNVIFSRQEPKPKMSQRCVTHAAVTRDTYLIFKAGWEPSAEHYIRNRKHLVDFIHHQTVLRCMSLENGNKLSKEEAYQSALEILTFMKEYGVNLAPHAYTAFKATPVLVFTQNVEDAAVIWECGLTNQDDGSLIVIRLDDETGKMLSFIYVGNEISIQNSDTTFTVLSASDWGKMCVEYYGFMSVEAKPLFLESREENHAWRL